MTISTCADIIRTYAREKPDATCIVFGERRISWSALHEKAKRLAQAMVSEGVGATEHVAFIDKNGPEYFEFQFGVAMLNAVTVNVNWRLAAPEIEYTINDSKAKVLIVGPEFYDSIEQIEKNLATVTKIVALGEHPRWEGYEDWCARQPATDPMVTSGPGDICVQLYTSGTTGLPKGVMLMNSNLFSLLPNVSSSWGFSAPDCVNLVCMPLFHIGGAGWALGGMLNGAVTVLIREFVAHQVLDALVEHNVTTALFVPAMLGVLAMVPGAAERIYPIRTLNYGASPITNETLLAAMRTFKCDFNQVYGMTETTGAITQLDAADHDPDGPRSGLLRSAGKPYSWVEARVVDMETGTDCRPGAVGELWTRSPQNMLGYWANPEATAATITTEGWLKTGDAGYFDEGGYLFLTDRVKDMIVSGGENVYPAEVENALASHPAIAEVAVIGVPSERWGETVKAVVALRPGQLATALQIIAFAKERLAGYKCPTSVDFIDELPRNPSGKVLKKDLREPYWAGRDRRIN